MRIARARSVLKTEVGQCACPGGVHHLRRHLVTTSETGGRTSLQAFEVFFTFRLFVFIFARCPAGLVGIGSPMILGGDGGFSRCVAARADQSPHDQSCRGGQTKRPTHHTFSLDLQNISSTHSCWKSLPTMYARRCRTLPRVRFYRAVPFERLPAHLTNFAQATCFVTG